MEERFKLIIDSLMEHNSNDSLDMANTIFPEGYKFESIETLGYIFLHPLKSLIRGLFMQKSNIVYMNDNLAFLIDNYEFVEHHFGYWIKKIEGSSCHADKSGYLMAKLIKHFLKGEEIIHDYSGKYTYYLPKTIFAKHSEIIDFFGSVSSLFYGNPTKYLSICKLFIDEKYMEIESLKYCHRFVEDVKSGNMEGWRIPKGMDLDAECRKKIETIRGLISNDTGNKLPENITSLYK